MTTLAAQQQALLDALFASPGAHPVTEALPFQGVRGLAAYRGNAREQACRCLGTTFPVLTHMLGDDNLDGLAGVFWLAHPPQTGDLAQWGGALAGMANESNHSGAPSFGRRQSTTTPLPASLARLANW